MSGVTGAAATAAATGAPEAGADRPRQGAWPSLAARHRTTARAPVTAARQRDGPATDWRSAQYGCCRSGADVAVAAAPGGRVFPRDLPVSARRGPAGLA